MTFNGFISYSHAADGRLAPAIQRGLHRLAKPWHRRRALWVFRDETGLSVTPSLWSAIQRALDDSEHFVLLASPEAASSPWVNREIEHWVATKSADRILPVVTGGEWRWDPVRRDFAEDSTAVPAALRGVFTDEPLYLDLRWARDDRHLSLRHSRFRDAIAQLAAPMHGMSKDDLEGDDVRHHRRARRLQSVAVAALVVLTLVASLTGMFAVRNATRANAEAAEARHQQQIAVEQHSNAQRSADEALRQQDVAKQQQQRARDAAAEATRQEQRARDQAALADQAAAEAGRQERLAGDQKTLAEQAAADAKHQQTNARAQQELAERAAARAEEQQRIAQQQRELAQRWAEQARQQEQIAAEQQRLAQQATDEAQRQQAKAEQQQRIAIGRRLNNQATSIAADDTKTALMLAVAATKVQGDDESRGQLAGLITSTHYAGTLDQVEGVEYIANDVMLTRDPNDRLKLWRVANRANPTLLADLGEDQTWAVSPDGRTVAAAAYHQDFVTLFNVTKPSAPDAVAKIPVPLNTNVGNLTFSQDGRTLFVGAWNPAAEDVGDLWDVSDVRRPKPLATRFGGSEFVTGAAFSPDGNTLVTQQFDGSTDVWDLTVRTDPQLRNSLTGVLGDEQVVSMAFLRNAPVLVAGCNKVTLLIDLSNPAQPKQDIIMANEGGGVTSVIVSLDGRRLVTGDIDGLMTVFDLVGTGVLPRRVDSVKDLEGMRSAALSPDGRTITTADWHSIATQWNVAAYGAPETRTGLTASGEQGLAMAFTPDGRSMLTVGANMQAVVWDLTGSSAPVRRATPTVHDRPIRAAAVTPDGRIVAARDSTGRVTVTDLTYPTSPVPVAKFQEPADSYPQGNDLVISPDGKTLAVRDDRGDVALWDVSHQGRPNRLALVKEAGMPVAFSPAGRTMAISNQQGTEVSLWTLDGPAGPAKLGPLGSLDRTAVQTIAFSPDGRTVSMGGFDQAGLWDVSQDHPHQSAKLSNPGQVVSLVFSPDGRTVATVDLLSQAKIWDYAHAGDPVKVADLQFVPQMYRNNKRFEATFSRDGRTLATSEASASVQQGAVMLWDLTKLAELRADPSVQACAVTGRGLTEDEWARYIPELPYQSTCPG